MFLQTYMPDIYKDYVFYLYKDREEKPTIDQIKQQLEEKKTQKLYIEEVALRSLTDSFSQMDKTHPARRMIEKRQIPLNKIRFCKNFYDLTKTLLKEDTFKSYKEPCIIIPFFKKNKQIEIFQARFFNPKITPKYLTVKFNPDAQKIYNADYIDPEKTVWILEGPIDSMFVENSVAMAGADIKLDYKDQVWVYDNERNNEEINKKVLTKIEKNSKVVIYKVSDKFKDINDGIMKGMFEKKDIISMLRERTFSGLKAKLEFTKFKRG
jgi:hypothetical protein